MCGTEADFGGVQAFVSNGVQTVAMTPIGSMFQCSDWDLDDDRYIAKVIITFNEQIGIKHMQALDQMGLGLEWGRKSILESDE